MCNVVYLYGVTWVKMRSMKVFICSPLTNHINSWWDYSYLATTRLIQMTSIVYYMFLEELFFTRKCNRNWFSSH